MTPVPLKPKVVVLVNENRELVVATNNVSPDMEVVIARNPDQFVRYSTGLPTPDMSKVDEDYEKKLGFWVRKPR